MHAGNGGKTIIALVGFARSGKGAVADFLVSERGFVKMKFADGLKNMLRSLGLSEREIEGDLKEQPCALLGGQTPRHAMLTLGTEWGRDMIHRDLWALALKKKLLDSTADRIVIDDCRFLNEAEIIHNLGGTIWHIFRPGYGPIKNHPSEWEHLKIAADFKIDNSGALEDLRSDVLAKMSNATPPERAVSPSANQSHSPDNTIRGPYIGDNRNPLSEYLYQSPPVAARPDTADSRRR